MVGRSVHLRDFKHHTHVFDVRETFRTNYDIRLPDAYKTRGGRRRADRNDACAILHRRRRRSSFHNAISIATSTRHEARSDTDHHAPTAATTTMEDSATKLRNEVSSICRKYYKSSTAAFRLAPSHEDDAARCAGILEEALNRFCEDFPTRDPTASNEEDTPSPFLSSTYAYEEDITKKLQQNRKVYELVTLFLSPSTVYTALTQFVAYGHSVLRLSQAYKKASGEKRELWSPEVMSIANLSTAFQTNYFIRLPDAYENIERAHGEG